MNLLIYIIKTIFISGVLLGYYGLFLRNRVFHGFNRFFLLAIPFLSFGIPALQFNWPALWNPVSAGLPIRLLGVGRGTLEEAFTVYASGQNGTGILWQNILFLISMLISSFLFIRFYKSVHFLRKLRRDNPFIPLPEATLYFVSEKGTPFSFLKSIFWAKEMDIDSEAGQQILRHELFHVKHKHTLDILILEIFSVLLWFNPFLYIIIREIKAIHEYGADAFAASETDNYAYASLLLWNISGTPLPLTHPFFKNQIKRRIAMITKSKKNKNLLGRFMILPLIAIMLGLFSFKIQHHFHLFSAKPIRVVIDAGHGGIYPGVTFNNIQEKDINLGIARKIQSLSKEYNVEVFMSRDKDESPGSNNLSESLTYIAGLAESKNANLLVSIHANGLDVNKSQEDHTGFEIYVSGNIHPSNKKFENSVKLASSIEAYIKPDFTITQEVKIREKGVKILEDSKVPAILIECGYLDNPSDMKYLQDEKQQEKIARDILEGIRKYSMESVSDIRPSIQSADSIPSDTISGDVLNKLDPNQIQSMDVDTKTGLIKIQMKNGKKYFTIITPEMTHAWDSANKAVQKKGGVQDNIVFTEVEEPASFPGGQEAWVHYLIKNLQYPPTAVKNEIQGEVMVEFIVRKDGHITDIHVLSGPESLRNESVRAVKESGKWLPAKQNGLIVDSYHKQPFIYKLEKKS